MKFILLKKIKFEMCMVFKIKHISFVNNNSVENLQPVDKYWVPITEIFYLIILSEQYCVSTKNIKDKIFMLKFDTQTIGPQETLNRDPIFKTRMYGVSN